MTTPTELLSRLRRLSEYGRKSAASGELSLVRQWIEILLILARGGNGPGYYYMAGMQRRSIEWNDKIAHLGSRAYLKAVRSLNDSHYHKLSQHKLAEKAIMAMMGVATPRFLGYFHTQAGRTCRHEPLTNLEQLSAFLCSISPGRVCIKMAEGSGGIGFRAFECAVAENTLRLRSLDDGHEMTASALHEHLAADASESGEGLIIEEYLNQHPDLAALSHASVNSVRLWVVLDDRGEARFPLAFLRMGRGNSLVDNRSRGGLVAPVDVNTGIVSVAYDGYPSRAEFHVHPDTRARIVGRQLPDWPEALALAEHAVRVFPGIRFAGVDIAFADTGPVVLELNVEPDRTGAAITGVPSGRALRA
jgi:hypothetical protein